MSVRNRSSLVARLALGVALATAAVPAALAQAVDLAKSRVTATFRQMNVPVDAQFTKFTANIGFDAARPAEARATIEIDTASFDLGKGAEEYNSEVRKKEWFDSRAHPKAVFVANGARALGGGRFEAPGKLTIKGRTLDVVAPFTVKTEGGAQVFEGQLPIKRLAFNIGEGEWKDTSMVADDVVVKFRVVTAAR